MPNPDPSPGHGSLEWETLRACARTNAWAASAREIRDLSAAGPDWRAVLRSATDHGVTGLVSETLSRLPELDLPAGVREKWTEAHRALARANLRLAHHLHRILDALEGARVPVLPFKGPVLAVRAYGDVSRRAFGDLDLLIREEDLDAARRALTGAGLKFEPGFEAIPDDLVRRWGKAMPFVTEDDSSVEVHWRLAGLFWRVGAAADEVWDRAALSAWMGRPVLGFSAEDQLLFLCRH